MSWTQANKPGKRLSFLAQASSCLGLPTLRLDQGWSTSPPSLSTVKTYFCLLAKDTQSWWVVFTKTVAYDLQPYFQWRFAFEAYVALGVNKISFFKLFRGFQKCLSKTVPLYANCESKHPVVLLSRLFASEVGKRFSFALHVLLYSCPCL